MIFDVGRVCKKIAGRDAGEYCFITDRIDGNFVKISGPNVRSRRVNVDHLFPLKETVASDSELVEKMGIVARKKGEKRESKERPRKVRKVKEKPKKLKKSSKKK